MATIYKILGQECPTNTNETTLYTVPSATSTVVSSLNISNLTGVNATATVNIKKAGASASNANTLLKTITIGPYSISSFSIGITLATTDVVSVTSGTASALSFQIFGSEIT